MGRRSIVCERAIAMRFARAMRRVRTPTPSSRTSSDLGPSSWGRGLGQEHGGRAREGLQTWGKRGKWVFLSVCFITTSISLATRDGCEKESVGGVHITFLVDSLAEEFGLGVIALSSAEECFRGASVYSV